MTAVVDSSASALAGRLRACEEVLARTLDPLDVPFGLDFRPFDAPRHLEAWRSFATLARSGRLHPRLVVYVHLPFCAQLCSYCLLAALPTPGRRGNDAYLEALHREIALYGRTLDGLPITTLHFGGGTPSLLSAAQLERLLTDLERAFSRADDFHIGFEAHPSSSSDAKLAVLARHGVRRISYGVETFTPAVLAAVGRGEQTLDSVAAAVNGAHRAGIHEVNLDLLAGLPHETEDSFAASVQQALALGATSLSVNRFIAENSALATSGQVPDDAANAAADAMLLTADRLIRQQRPPSLPPEPLAAPAYGSQYVWGAAFGSGYFQQDMIGPTSILALGHGGLGHLHAGSFHTSAGTPDDYVAALARDEPPPVLVTPVSRRFEMAFDVADGACRGRFSPQTFRATFGQDVDAVFGAELRFLRDSGRLDGWNKPPRADFQVTHLLAFLLFDTTELQRRGQAMPTSRSERAELSQYRRIAAELPPSLLWCRIAMRATAARRALL